MSLERPKVKCPSCKSAVDIGRVHCPQCGEMLTRGNKPPKPIKRRDPNAKNPLLVLLRMLLTLALLAAVVLMLTPTEGTGKTGAELDERRYAGKINLVERAINDGSFKKTVLSEQEINARMARIVRDQPGVGNAVPVSIDEISVDIKKDTIIAYLNKKVWVIHLTYQFEMRPVVQGDGAGFAPKIVSAQLGKLPLVSVTRGLVVSQFRKTLDGLKQEKTILEQLSSIKITDDTVAFEVNSPSAQ